MHSMLILQTGCVMFLCDTERIRECYALCLNVLALYGIAATI